MKKKIANKVPEPSAPSAPVEQSAPSAPTEPAAPTAPANAKTDEATKRANRLWRLYCARIAAYDPSREMRGKIKYMRDEFQVAVTALEVFEEEISKLGGCNVK